MAVASKRKNYRGQKASKNDYRTALGTTEHNIPMFGFKSAALISVVLLLTLGFIPEILQTFMKDPRWLSLLLCSVINGFVVAFSQFKIERKLEFSKNFYLVWLAVGLLVAFALFFAYYARLLV